MYHFCYCGRRAQEEISWILCFRVSGNTVVKGWVLIYKSPAEGPTSKLTDLSFRKIQFFVDCWTEGFISFLAIGRGWPQFLAPWASMTWHDSLFHQSQQVSKSTSKMKVTVLYKWITDVTSYCVYHILFIRNKTPYLAHT